MSAQAVENVETLPGLSLPAPATSSLERKAIEYVGRLRAAGQLEGNRDLLAELVLDLARTVGAGARSGKAAGVALASRQLLDAMDKLAELTTSGDEVDQFERMRALVADGPE